MAVAIVLVAFCFGCWAGYTDGRSHPNEETVARVLRCDKLVREYNAHAAAADRANEGKAVGPFPRATTAWWDKDCI